MKKKIKIIIIISLVIIIGLSVFIHFRQEEQNKIIRVSGNIEATEVRLSFRVPGKIQELFSDEGKVVKKGEVLARLDTDELAQIKNQAQGSLAAAEYQYSLDKADYERAENLFKEGAVSAQKRDLAKTKADADKANLDALRAAFELANTRLGFADLTSPIDGSVLVKSAEAGEVVQAGATVFTVADLTGVWLTAYINETDLGRVKLNQAAEIKTDTYPAKVYKGRVSFISQESEFTPKQIQTSEERVKLVYRIKIRAENTNLELKPGMPADGYILE
jgi:HlyD family secretion protein